MKSKHWLDLYGLGLLGAFYFGVTEGYVLASALALALHAALEELPPITEK